MRKQTHYEAVRGDIVAALRAARLERGLSMNRVAEIAGLSQQMVSYVERGMRSPTLDTILRVADALEVDLAEILRRTQRKFRGR